MSLDMAYNVEKEYILQTEIILLMEVTLLLEYILQTEVRSRNLPEEVGQILACNDTLSILASRSLEKVVVKEEDTEIWIGSASKNVSN